MQLQILSLLAVVLGVASASPLDFAEPDMHIESRATKKCAYFYKSNLVCPRDDGDVIIYGGKKYRAYCGFDISDNDLSRGNTQNLKECLTLCTNTGGCVGVSHYRSGGTGDNCFLKSAVTNLGGSGGVVDAFIIVAPNKS